VKAPGRTARRILVAGIAVLIAGTALFLTWAARATPTVKDKVVAALNERFASQVELDSLTGSVIPRPRASGTGLRLRHNGRTDVPPLISIDGFEASANVLGLWRRPVRLHEVALDGLTILIPAGGLGKRNGDDAGDEAPHVAHPEKPSPIMIDRIVSRAARLEIRSSKPGRLPRVWEIHDLVMRDFGASGGSRFEAGLTNAIPSGRIETTGSFGPWHQDEPGLTPVSGEYTFKEADLDDIKGIGGLLSSVGRYDGVLERIEVQGQTETPDFSIDIAGRQVPLSTRFTAVVDGTNGDTLLERVEARLNNSTILARGSVVRAEDVKGRRVALDVRLDAARLEDILALAVDAAQPPLVGRVDMATSFLLPAGEADVIDRLQLEGTFRLAQARFTSFDVQQRIATLSRRGRGVEHDEGIERERVVSNLRGRFRLRNAALTFSQLTFAVPGSRVELSGSYDLRSEAMNFKGYLLTDATLADMTSGIKSLLARVAQPLFRREGGGSRLPIHIRGTRGNPEFGLDVGRVFGRD
jgi:hypothetical protein